MNVALSLVQGSAPVVDEQALAVMREFGLTVELDAAQLAAIHDAMDAVMNAASFAASLLRAAAGPVPSSLPQQLVTLLLMGTGYHRVARDTIRALFMARNSARRSARRKKGAD